jgi:hypothetical protein
MMTTATAIDVSIGERIRAKRLELRLSQRELSTRHVSYAYISRIEHGTRTPSVKALREIAPKLGVSVHWLETGETTWSVCPFTGGEFIVERLRDHGVICGSRCSECGRPPVDHLTVAPLVDIETSELEGACV